MKTLRILVALSLFALMVSVVVGAQEKTNVSNADGFDNLIWPTSML